jgi:hypothetical protein
MAEMISNKDLDVIKRAVMKDMLRKHISNAVDYASDIMVRADAEKKQCTLFFDRIKNEVELSIGNDGKLHRHNRITIALWVVPSDWKDSYGEKIPVEDVLGVTENDILKDYKNIEEYIRKHTIYRNYAEALAEFLMSEYSFYNPVERILQGEHFEDVIVLPYDLEAKEEEKEEAVR